MKQITTEIIINATPPKVWEILMDFPKYSEWNPFIVSISGSASVGAKLDVRIQPPGGRGMGFGPTVLVAEANREFRWVGHFLIPGIILDGEHSFTLYDLGGKTRFVQAEVFKGLLTFMVPGRTREGFEGMNEALKKRAEMV